MSARRSGRPALPPFRDDAGPRDRGHRRAARRNEGQLRRQGRQERGRLRPGQALLRLPGTARAGRAARAAAASAARGGPHDRRRSEPLAGRAPLPAGAERRRPRPRAAARVLRGLAASRRRAGGRARRRGGRPLGGAARAAGAAARACPLGRAGGAARPPGPARRLPRAGDERGLEPPRRARTRRLRPGGQVQPELIADCVHCGFCLPTCPTYALWHEEMDSPRGRIYLMAGLVDGTLPLSDTVVEHFDRCLGCMACVTACPSGVQYDKLIESTRAFVEEHHSRGPGERLLRALIFSVFPHRRRLRVALAFRKLPAPGPFAPLAEIAPPWLSAEWPPERLPGPGASVALLAGCVQSVVFGDVNAATARVLAADGYDVHVPRSQGCCGALAIHAGRREDGLSRARELIAELEAYELVVSN